MVQETMEQKEQKNQEYNEYVKQVTPTHSLPANMLKAFITGGAICVVGQVILNVAAGTFGLDKDTAGSWCSLLLVLLSVVLTGFNIYPSLANWGGAGALVPITGLPTLLQPRRLSSRKKGRSLGLGARFLRLQGR